MKIESLEISKLKDHKLQSEVRTSSPALKSLAAAYAATGFLTPPLVLQTPSGVYHVLDGHRRIAVGDAGGATRIQCVVITADEFKCKHELLFVHLNAVPRKFSAAEWLYGWAVSAAKKDFRKAAPKPYQRLIAFLVDVYGEEKAVQMAHEGKIPGTLANLVALVRSHFSFAGLETVQDIEISDWILKHRMAGALPRVQFTPSVVRRINQSIAADEPFKFTERTVLSKTRSLSSKRPGPGPAST